MRVTIGAAKAPVPPSPATAAVKSAAPLDDGHEDDDGGNRIHEVSHHHEQRCTWGARNAGTGRCRVSIVEERRSGDEVIHSILDVMYAKAPWTVIRRAMHIHPTVSELVPTMLSDLRPMD
jgi:hypothetical protein